MMSFGIYCVLSRVVRMLCFFEHGDISRWCVLRNVEYESEE